MPLHTAFQIEACVESFSQAIDAFERGADRLEVCSQLETEGMTPDVDLIERLLKHVTIPVRVMIRETPVGFECDNVVLEKMIASIHAIAQLPVDGFVLGLLKGKKIDRTSMLLLMEACSPFPITFHKAIDLVDDLDEEISWLNNHPQGDTILTGGGAIHAIDGADPIKRMRSKFKGEVMAGGKITKDNLQQVHEALQLKWYHGKAVV